MKSRLLAARLIIHASALIDICARARSFKTFLNLVPHRGFLRKLSQFTCSCISHIHILFIVLFRHLRPPSWKQYTMAFALVYGGYMFFPWIDSSAEIVPCPDGIEYRIPEGPHTGRMVRCEDFDAYYRHMLRAEEYAGWELTYDR